MANLSRQQIDGLQRKLEPELARLIKETRQKMRPEEKANYSDIDGNVADSGDDAVADTLIDTDNAIIGQHLQQIGDIEAALQRIQQGSYGTCIECGGEIGYERISAYPTAKRCIRCQSVHEKTYAHGTRATL